jgi:5-methylcytosine-specific restriction protein B
MYSINPNDPNDPVSAMVQRYKAHVAGGGLINEVYKWELIAKFRGKPNVNAPDFYEEIKSTKYGNLLYQIAVPVIKELAQNYPKEYRACFRQLFDERVDLSIRIRSFKEGTKELYQKLKSGTRYGTHHDERTIATILTVHDPLRYAFYKNSFYQKFCNLLGIGPNRTGEKLVHYLHLLDRFIERYIDTDPELLEIVDKNLPRGLFDDANHKLLAQDILYQMLDLPSDGSGYWVFQSTPRSYDLIADLEAGNNIGSWSVSAHKDKIQEGDKVILWVAGRDAGCYAFAETTGEPVEEISEFGSHRVGIELTHNLIDKPILWYEVKNTEGLEKLKVGRQGTTFQATEKEFEIMQSLIREEVGQEVITKIDMPLNTILFGPPGTGKTYNSIDKAVEIIKGGPSQPHAQNKKDFDEFRKQGQIEFVTFHQSYSYEDFVVGITPDTSAGVLRFDKRDGIFKQICERARQNWAAVNAAEDRTPDFDYVFRTFFSKLIEEEVKVVEIPMRSKGYKFTITSIKDDERIRFTKQSGGTADDLLVKNVRAIYEGTLSYGEQGLGVYYYPLNDKLKEFAATLQPEKQKEEAPKNFVLVIDEINRANISKVFGELITLLEDDKRLGGESELRVTLPGGEKDFAVPPNLYIVGTMNTADKSIALVDIALRRRFDFISYYPDYEKIKNPDAVDLLRTINLAIFDKKRSADYLIGHAYFMNDQPIETVLQNKVVPLLMEYFSSKTEIVSGIFSGSGWNVSYDQNTYKWNINRI